MNVCKCCNQIVRNGRYYLLKAIALNYHGLRMIELFDYNSDNMAYKALQDNIKLYNLTEEEIKEIFNIMREYKH